MFLSNPVKLFLSSSLFLFSFAGCSWWEKTDNTTETDIIEARHEFPFLSREPEVFQAEVVVSTGGIERKTFVAQNGGRRRIDYDIDGANRRSILYTDGKFVISHGGRIYAEVPQGGAAPIEDSLTTLLANSRIYTSFTPLGEENGLSRYSAKMGEGPSSEVLIFVDQVFGMPVRQEFYSVEGGNRTLTFSVELRNVKREAGKELFEIPSGFRRVSIEEFTKKERSVPSSR